MKVAKNNPYDLMGNDPDFLAAAVYADKKTLYSERRGNGRQILARVDDAPHGRGLAN